MAAISGPGDQLWQLQAVRGTSCGSYKWSGGPVVAATSSPGDQLWKP